MKKLKSIIALFVMLFLTSCEIPTTVKFDHHIKKVENNSDDWTEEEWEMSKEQYRKLLKEYEENYDNMTPEERDNPSIINTSRKKRIAKGCGMELQEINQFISQFDQMRKMMKGFTQISDKVKSGKMKLPKMPKGFGGNGKFPF